MGIVGAPQMTSQLVYFIFLFVLHCPNPGGDWPRIVWMCDDVIVTQEQGSLVEPLSLQVEYMAVKFVMEPFRQSGTSLQAMKTSAQ